MQQEKDLEVITETFAIWNGRIRSRKAMYLNDSSILSEDLAGKLLNIIYGLELENLNLTDKKRANGVDLGDKVNGLAFQISTNNSSQKISKSLEIFVKENLISTYRNGIRFLILFQPAIRNGKTNYKGIFKLFDPKNHILTDKDLLKAIRNLYTSDKSKFNKIKKILAEEFLPRNTEDLAIQAMIAYDVPMTREEKIQLIKEKNDYERSKVKYYCNPVKVLEDFEVETRHIMDLVAKIVQNLKNSRSQFYGDHDNHRCTTIMEKKSLVALSFQWTDINALTLDEGLISEKNLTLVAGIFAVKNFRSHYGLHNTYELQNLSSQKYTFYLNKTLALGWIPESGREEFVKTDELVAIWENALINKLAF